MDKGNTEFGEMKMLDQQVESEYVWNEPTNVEEGAHLDSDKDFDELYDCA